MLEKSICRNAIYEVVETRTNSLYVLLLQATFKFSWHCICRLFQNTILQGKKLNQMITVSCITTMLYVAVNSLAIYNDK